VNDKKLPTGKAIIANGPAPSPALDEVLADQKAGKIGQKRELKEIGKDGIEDKVCRYAKGKGLVHRKFTAAGRRSVPDRVFYGGGGLVFWVEFKRKGKEPTHLQWGEINMMRERGLTVFVCDSVEDGKRLVDYMTAVFTSPPP